MNLANCYTVSIIFKRPQTEKKLLKVNNLNKQLFFRFNYTVQKQTKMDKTNFLYNAKSNQFATSGSSILIN